MKNLALCVPTYKRADIIERFLHSEIDIINNYYLNWNEKDIEPIQTICKRVWNLLDEIQEKYKGKNVLLVTHGGTCRAINAYFNGIGEEGHVKSAHIKNCEIREYEYKQK